MAKNKIVLSGYYGFSNAGDEAMLYSILRSLTMTIDNPEITVISGHPEVPEQQFNVKQYSVLYAYNPHWGADEEKGCTVCTGHWAGKISCNTYNAEACSKSCGHHYSPG